MPPLQTSNSNLTLSYDASDILGDNDKSLFLHKRPLLNADTMVKKGLYKSALEIYYRAVGKITNPEIQKKIQKNISDIHNYLRESDPDSEKAFLEKYSDTREKEFSESLKELTENLSDSLTEKLNILKQIETIPEEGSGNPAFADRAPKPAKKDDSEIKPMDLGSLDAKGKPKSEPTLEVEEEPEEIEGNLEYDVPETSKEESSKESDTVDPSKKEAKKKKPKKANIKVKKEPEEETSTIETESTEIQAEQAEIQNESADIKTESANIQNESADIKTESAEIQNESAEIETESANIENESADIKTESADIQNESAEIKTESTDMQSKSADFQSETSDVHNESAEFKNEGSEIFNESAEFKNETTIQNASLDSDAIQIENENITNVSQTGTSLPPLTSELPLHEGISELSEEGQKSTIPSQETEIIKESKTVEEIRIVKEYKEAIDTPPPEEISRQRKGIDSEEVDSSSIQKTKSTQEESEQLLFPPGSKTAETETGWSELENEDPKPKADKDYAPLMKKYEAGNIEIPESTEFITAEFKSEESKNLETGINDSQKTGGKPTESQSQTGSSGSSQPGIGNVQGLSGGGTGAGGGASTGENIISDPSMPQNEGGKQPVSYQGGVGEGMLQGILGGVSEEKTNKGSQQAYNVPPLPPPLPLNINDWLSNLYFSKEWEKFKPLPMKERRTGKDRRVSTSKQLPKGIKKNRRSGTDRRKQKENLLNEREEFLQDWQKEAQSIPSALSQILGNITSPAEQGFASDEIQKKESVDPNLQSLEFLPRDPSYTEKLPTSEELLKVELPNPEEIVLKQPLDQNEVPKESVSSNIEESITRYVPANEELGLLDSDKGLVKIDLPDPILFKAEDQELPHREVSGEIEVSSKDGTGIVGDGTDKDRSGMGPVPYTPEAYAIPDELKIELPDPDDYVRTKSGHLIDPFAPEETPEINMIEGEGLPEGSEEGPEISEIPELPPPPPEPERTIHGILELKPPEIDDAPFLTLTYDFSKIPHPFKLSKNYSIMEYSYYKYKPMLMKAQEFARRKMLKNALNYYRVIKSQNIPPELKNMINRNITDITEFLEKFIMSKGGG